MAAFSFLVACVFVPLVGAIYPDDHWTHSTEITTDNADEFVKTNVDAGKTVFIRWIASAG